MIRFNEILKESLSQEEETTGAPNGQMYHLTVGLWSEMKGQAGTATVAGRRSMPTPLGASFVHPWVSN